MANPRISMVATGRSGVGHLRRLSHVATALRRKTTPHITLVTNAAPLELPWFTDGPYDAVVTAERDTLSRRVIATEPEIVLVDTAVIPGIEDVRARRVLLLRACRDVARFANPVPWDDVLLPHPAREWTPVFPPAFARSTVWVGWVHGNHQRLVRGRSAGQDRRILAAFGGGGAMTRDASTNRKVWAVVEALRSVLRVRVSLLSGPRMSDVAHESVDEIVPAQGDPRALYAGADLVVSAAGYNSVLELASVDTPVLFAPAARTHDDQFSRAHQWADKMGHVLEDVGRAVAWGRRILVAGERRDAVDLPGCGSDRIASVLLGTGTS